MGQQLEVTEVAGRRIAGIRHRGPYERVSETFVELFPLAQALGLAPEQAPGAAYVAVYLDDPARTSAEQLRSFAGVTAAEDADIGELEEERLPAGRYARMTFIGPHAGLGGAWAQFGRAFQEAGYARGPGPAYEVYFQTDPSTPPEKSRTDLYQPIGGPTPSRWPA